MGVKGKRSVSRNPRVGRSGTKSYSTILILSKSIKTRNTFYILMFLSKTADIKKWQLSIKLQSMVSWTSREFSWNTTKQFSGSYCNRSVHFRDSKQYWMMRKIMIGSKVSWPSARKKQVFPSKRNSPGTPQKDLWQKFVPKRIFHTRVEINSPVVGSTGREELRSNREPACHLP